MPRFATRWGLLAALALAAAWFRPDPATASPLDSWRGHIAVGYAKLFSDSLAPGGSLSVGAGVDRPLGERFRLGPEINFHLLGSATVVRGSLAASLDYSALEGALLLSWLPEHGPVSRLSAGPALGSAHADLSTSGGGAGFSDLAVGQVRGGFALQATSLLRRDAPISPALEAGLRVFRLEQQTWSLFTLRAAVHY